MARVGTVNLTAGRHQLQIFRPGGSLKPGNGQSEVYDTIFLDPAARLTPLQRPPAAARSLSGRHLDWIEVVSGR